MSFYGIKNTNMLQYDYKEICITLSFIYIKMKNWKGCDAYVNVNPLD